MKNVKTPEIVHLITTKQYWVAVWKIIDSRPLIAERKPLDDVDALVHLAVGDQALTDLKKIGRDFMKYVGDDAAAALYGALNETTEIDLQPDEL